MGGFGNSGSDGGDYTARFPVYFDPERLEGLKDRVKKQNLSRTIRALVNGFLEGKVALDLENESVADAIPGSHLIGEPSSTLEVVGVSYGGPGQPVILDGRTSMGITDSMARYLGYQDGDSLVQVSGDSMAEAGIVDGSLVLMYDLNSMNPARGEIVLVEIVDEDGNHTSTLKRYRGRDDRGLPRLENGAGEPYEYEEGTVSATVIMAARASITRL